MNVSEVMANIVHTVNKDEHVVGAAMVMKRYDTGCVIVGSENNVEGLITDRDLVRRAVASGKSLDQVMIKDVMTSRPVSCREDDTLKQAAIIMEKHRVRRLPVLDYHDQLVGIVSLGDICTHAPVDLAGELIKAVSSPEHHVLAETA